MATNRSKLSVNGLDFDDIKNNLKAYLKNQDQFKDYDFEGSGLNILLDVLADNTHYQAFYANQVANETFLDSCKIEESAISIAKHLDYVPRSYKSAVAYVNVEFFNLSNSVQEAIKNGTGYYISKGDIFSAKDAFGNTITFLATDSFEVKYKDSKYIAENVEIKEGSYKTITYVIDNSNESLRYFIPDENVDISTLSVRVQNSIEDNTGSTILWNEVTDLNKLSADSTSYFIQKYENKYQIYFGDGIVGKQPDTGNVLTLKYLVSSGSEGNDIGKNESSTNRTFTYLSNSNTKTSLVTDADGNYVPSYGGSSSETIQSIKYYAPRNYQAQERAVTAEDYRTLLARQYGEQAESVFVWGGEDNDPPIYGKVFISIKPNGAQKYTSAQKLSIAKNILKERNLISIIPEIIDPEYLYILVTSNVLYDSSKTSLTNDALVQQIKLNIMSYGDTQLEKFDRNFRYSKFTSFIDGLSESFLSNSTTLKLQKRFEPNLDLSSSYSLKFDNELFHPIDGYTSIVESSGFGYFDPLTSSTQICYLDDDGSGNMRIYKLVNQDKIYINSSAGTIDYTTGKIVLPKFKPLSFYPTTNTNIQITVIPKNKDIYSRRNLILVFDNNNISVTATPETVRYDPYKSSASSFPNNT